MTADRFAGIGTVALVYDADALADGADAASRDVEDQLQAMAETVASLGGHSVSVGMDLDLGAARSELARLGPGLIVNLVESLGGSDRMQAAAAMLFEDMRLPFTGSGAMAMLIANHKQNAKRRLVEAGVPVPAAVFASGGGPSGQGDWIVKTLESHASLHLDDGMVLHDATPEEAAAKVRDSERRHGQAFFAEQYIDGREFNLSVLADGLGGAEVLPPAEIRFENWDPALPRIVGYAAKWEEESERYARSVRHFDFAGDDAPLLRELAVLARRTWDALGMTGYARVDFRVDASGRPFVLEANANPCLTPGAGFAAAVERAGLTYAQMLLRIAAAALGRTI